MPAGRSRRGAGHRLSGARRPVDVAGVKLEDSLDLRGTPLQLNGAGVRYKAILKVYTAGLYMGRKASTPRKRWPCPA